MDCRQFIDLGCLGYLIASLASKEEGVRRGGAHSLYRFRQHLKGARFKEKQQVVYTKLVTGISTLYLNVIALDCSAVASFEKLT